MSSLFTFLLVLSVFLFFSVSLDLRKSFCYRHMCPFSLNGVVHFHELAAYGKKDLVWEDAMSATLSLEWYPISWQFPCIQYGPVNGSVASDIAYLPLSNTEWSAYVVVYVLKSVNADSLFIKDNRCHGQQFGWTLRKGKKGERGIGFDSCDWANLNLLKFFQLPFFVFFE